MTVERNRASGHLVIKMKKFRQDFHNASATIKESNVNKKEIDSISSKGKNKFRFRNQKDIVIAISIHRVKKDFKSYFLLQIHRKM